MDDRRYFAYLLRCWQSSEEEMLVWRVSLEDPHTGERIGFATLEAAVAFLRERLWTTYQRPDDRQPPSHSAK
jgi:hypothetical protein